MKKIVTVSVLAIMAVSAANADIASTTYVDKTAAGAVTSGLASGGNIDTAIKTATTDMATQTWVGIAIKDMATDQEVAGIQENLQGQITAQGQSIQQHNTQIGTFADGSYAKEKGALTTAVNDLDARVTSVAGGNLELGPGSVTTTQILDGTVAEGDLNTTLADKINTAATTASGNAAAIGTLNTTTIPGINDAIQDLDNTKLDTADLPSNVSAFENDANYQTGEQVTTTINTATESGVIKDALDKKVDVADVSGLSVSKATAAENYTAEGGIASEFDKKQDKVTAVKYSGSQAVGSATVPVFVGADGTVAAITSYSGNAATATTATEAANYTAGGTIAAGFAKVEALGDVPVPDKCKTDAFDCTLVVKYDQAAGAAVPQWEAIAR